MQGQINLLKSTINKVRRSIIILNKNRIFHNKIPMRHLIDNIKQINRKPIIRTIQSQINLLK